MQVDLQAQARAHRIGQKRDVLVLRLETVKSFFIRYDPINNFLNMLLYCNEFAASEIYLFLTILIFMYILICHDCHLVPSLLVTLRESCFSLFSRLC